ncbi:MAG: hypothetical protein OXP12_09575 [Thaumarchaeota archaeon]|nr:hypothetical protein [Nitrososphaerota archaeon]
MAHEIATGDFLDSEQFSGGDESERFLQDLGFPVIVCDCGGYRRDAGSAPTVQQGLPRQDGSLGGDQRRPVGSDVNARPTPGRAAPPTLRVALVFPSLGLHLRPKIPAAGKFAGEDVDFVLFPEEYIDSSDETRVETLKKLASDLDAPLLVGALNSVEGDTTAAASCPDVELVGALNSVEGDTEILLRFDPGGYGPVLLYIKHSTADVVAFEMPCWSSRVMLPTFELGGVRAGATICHDHYLGLLQRHLAENGARLWLNPSHHNVIDVKWSSVLRLRAVENRLFALCTLHDDKFKRTTHPFAFSPDGNELCARKAGSAYRRPISDCTEDDAVYIVDLDVASTCKRLDWSSLPRANKQQRPNKNPKKPVRVSMRGGQPTVYAEGRWRNSADDHCIRTEHGKAYVGVISGKRILDAAARFRVICSAREMDCRPIIWNHWDCLPTEPDRLANLMMGVTIECCAPVIISDKTGIRELVELSNRNKIPVRRVVKQSEAVVDLGYAWGLSSALKMTTRNTTAALDLYRSLTE